MWKESGHRVCVEMQIQQSEDEELFFANSLCVRLTSGTQLVGGTAETKEDINRR
jgi:hypothetical protein